MTDQQTQKKAAIEMLRSQVPVQREQLAAIDARLLEYYTDLCEHSGWAADDANDWHNLYELLSALKLLRIMRTYPIDTAKVQQVIRLREGEWHREGTIWKYDSGGLLLPGTRGATHYRWMPYQVFILTAMYGANAWIDTEVPVGMRELLPTEREGVNGTIEDLRRLCTDFTFYAPRKTDKTGLSAYNNFLYFMLEDADAEIYCCANSQTQSKLLYDRTQMLIRQMDPEGRRIRFTASQTNWKPGQIRSAQLWALSAGGKTKDGLFAQLCCADEYGSAGYVNGNSDMGALVNVVLSSMGPRREPMMFTSTTAGTIKTGPFVDKLEGMKRELLKELSLPPTPPEGKGDSLPPTPPEGKGVLQSPNDRWMILPLCPDDWQIEDEYLLTNTTVRRKVNPALGVIVQNSFYEQKVASSRLDPLEKVETLTKLFNVYQNNKVTDWVKAEEIREVQVERRIDDCIDSEGWEVYVGSDFSKGDDLNGNSYLAVRWREDIGEMEFFADMDAYMSEEAVNDSPVRELLLKWAREGWLHIVPGKTFDPAVAVNRIVELNDKGVNFFGFGYDPYNAKTVINALTQWVVSDLGLDPKKLIRPVRQNFATYSPAVKEFDYMLRRGVQTQDGKTHPSPMIHFSMNPLWPWEFSNCVLMESTDGMENMKPVKASSAASCKVDNVQMLLSALILYDANE